MPAISVVVPVYNTEKYLRPCVDSILAQTFTDFELLLIDDGSTDHTEEIAKKYCALDGRVAYHRNESNMGAAATRNRGCFLARGEWIALLDSDDLWMENKLERQMKELRASGGYFSCSACRFITESGEKIEKTMNIPNTISYRSLLRANHIACSTVLCQREIMLEFPMQDGDIHEDYLTWLSILKKYGPIRGLNEYLMVYRIRKGSKASNKWKAVGMTYRTYKMANIVLPKRLFYMLCNMAHGVKKYNGVLNA
jgi:teichuronic acid biosynthesis glycosyltransferase TuaG